jgi:hypothetical protein
MAAKPNSGGGIVHLKVTLADIRPPIWRRLLMPASMTLGDLRGLESKQSPQERQGRIIPSWRAFARHDDDRPVRHFKPLSCFASDPQTLRAAAAFDTDRVLRRRPCGQGWCSPSARRRNRSAQISA